LTKVTIRAVIEESPLDLGGTGAGAEFAGGTRAFAG
jgi:hypothetical protein